MGYPVDGQISPTKQIPIECANLLAVDSLKFENEFKEEPTMTSQSVFNRNEKPFATRLSAQSLRDGCVVLALLLFVFSLALSRPTAAQTPPNSTQPPAAKASISPAVVRAVPAIVKVLANVPSDAQSAATLGRARVGSGVLIEPQLVLTIGYLLLEAETVDVVTLDGRKIPGSVAGYDHSTGFGLIRIVLPLDMPPLALGDSDSVVEKERVFTVGHGESEATELRIISRKVFAGSWEYLIDRPLYTFPPVNNWSGSALLSEDGKLVGIGSLIVNDAANDRKGVPGNLFVPTNLLKPILADLLAKGRRGGQIQPWLGITTEPVNGALMVARVSPRGPADLAGINAGDIVVGVGKEPIDNQADFYKKLWKAGDAGSDLILKVIQQGQLRDVKVRSIDRMDFLRKQSGI